MRSLIRSPVLLAVLLLLAPPPAAAQEAGDVRLRVDRSEGRVGVRLGGLLEEPALRSGLRSGLPLRVRARVELWKDRFFDRQEGQAEWRATVLHDPLQERYLLRLGEDREAPVVLDDLPAVARALEGLFTTRMADPGPGTYYYLGTVEVQTLSVSDLEELERWLRGDLAPSVGGEGNVSGAVTRGLRQLMIRMLDLPTRRIRLRSERFRVR